MRFVEILSLLSLGVVIGMFMVLLSIADVLQENFNSGYYVLRGQAYKVTKIKE